MELDKAIEKRRSIRKYSTKKINFEDVSEICNTARFAPCAANIYTVKIIIIEDKETRAKLANAALNQSFIADAPYVLVVCNEISLLKKGYGGFAETYCKQQAGAAIQNMLLKITELGLASCWVGAFEEEEIKRILKIPENVRIEALLPIAMPFPKMKIPEKRKPDLKNISFFNIWGKKYTEKRPMPAL